MCSSRVRFARSSSASAMPRFSMASLIWASATFSSPSALATSSAETMPGLSIVEPFVSGARPKAATSFWASAFSSGPMAVGLKLVLRDGELGDFVMQDADRAIFLDGHADLELHLLDHALAQGGDVRLVRSSRSAPALREPAAWTPGFRRRCVRSAGLSQGDGAAHTRQPAAKAAIGLGRTWWNEPPRLQGNCRAWPGFESRRRYWKSSRPSAQISAQCKNGQRNSTDS